jgi:sugar O-acyltransferase (sialic acid O-acetyltransferase NeuD family)
MRNKKLKMAFGLYGAGGFAREVMPIIREHVSRVMQLNTEEDAEVFFMETKPSAAEVNGHPLISEDEFFGLDCERRYFNIAIADSKTRERIAKQCIERGAVPMSVQAPNSVAYDRNEVGEGAIVCAYSMITSNTRIGRFFHANIYSYVAHDCVIGDFVTFAPNVHCNGNVHIKDHAYIGTGAIIKQGTSSKPLVIGEGAVVGMGAVVTKDVAPYTRVVGNPAKPHIKA